MQTEFAHFYKSGFSINPKRICYNLHHKTNYLAYQSAHPYNTKLATVPQGVATKGQKNADFLDLHQDLGYSLCQTLVYNFVYATISPQYQFQTW